MATQASTWNKPYIISVSILTFVLPAIGTLCQYTASGPFIGIAGKWFVFSAVGLRLFVAGIKQVTDPAFTASKIFHMESTDSFHIIRELGFANICFGLVGIASLFFPQWRVVSAFASGIYYGFAGIMHLVKKPAGVNEVFALFSDLFIFCTLCIYFILTIYKVV
jgi:hypothetical protein